MGSVDLSHLHQGAPAAHAATASDGSWVVGVVALGLIVVPFALLVVLACVRGARRRADDEDDDAGWGGGGGSRPTGPDSPPHPDDGLAWWPEFEREFAAWVEHTRVPGGPGPPGAPWPPEHQ
jgi:hypothetical protein